MFAVLRTLSAPINFTTHFLKQNGRPRIPLCVTSTLSGSRFEIRVQFSHRASRGKNKFCIPLSRPVSRQIQRVPGDHHECPFRALNLCLLPASGILSGSHIAVRSLDTQEVSIKNRTTKVAGRGPGTHNPRLMKPHLPDLLQGEDKPAREGYRNAEDKNAHPETEQVTGQTEQIGNNPAP